MLKILIVDDHAIVRRGLKQIVDNIPETVTVDEASNGKEALEKILSDDYDLVLLDITLPDRNGIDILYEIKRLKPETRILVLSVHPEEQYARRVFKGGASGYLTKNSAPDELVMAIREVASGKRYISSTFAEKMAFDFLTGTGKKSYENLSNREYQVMCMIASGKTIQEIAESLILSPKTIYTYRTRILAKLDKKNTAELIRYAWENRLLD